MSKHARLIGAVVGALLAAHGQAIGADAVPFPVIYKGENPTITMQVIGTYRGGWFSNRTPAGPEYDPSTNRLFVGSVDRKAVEALEISDLIAAGERQQPLTTPTFRIDLTAWGGEPNSIAIHESVVAVVVRNHDDPSQQQYVLLFSTDGALLADPIPIDRASRLAFAPNGQKLAVTLTGGPEWDPIQNKVVYYKAGVAIIDLGSVNWGECRTVPKKCNIKIPSPIPVADFTPFDTRREELIKAGVRILAPDPNVAVSDALHSESITISQDSRTAWVPLPRNNAIAVMDLQMPHFSDDWAARITADRAMVSMPATRT